MKTVRVIWIAVLLVLVPHVGLATDTPTLRNDMPRYLRGFQETVHRQAKDYPDVFFLSAVTDERVIALTFDDGPDRNTNRLLDILKEEQVSATFYVLGVNAIQYPEIIQRIVEEGHEIANHSWSHRDFRELTNEEILWDELVPTSQFIYDIVGIYPQTMRPPYGAVRDDTIEYLRDNGWKIINWSVDTFDWDSMQNSPEEILMKVVAYSHPGAIVLMHSGPIFHGTVMALPDIIRSLRDDGYEFLTVSDLLKAR